jgi:hypothetical protein
MCAALCGHFPNHILKPYSQCTVWRSSFPNYSLEIIPVVWSYYICNMFIAICTILMPPPKEFNFNGLKEFGTERPSDSMVQFICLYIKGKLSTDDDGNTDDILQMDLKSCSLSLSQIKTIISFPGYAANIVLIDMSSIDFRTDKFSKITTLFRSNSNVKVLHLNALFTQNQTRQLGYSLRRLQVLRDLYLGSSFDKTLVYTLEYCPTSLKRLLLVHMSLDHSACVELVRYLDKSTDLLTHEQTGERKILFDDCEIDDASGISNHFEVFHLS